jgi:hypothetical protein
VLSAELRLPLVPLTAKSREQLQRTAKACGVLRG